MNFTLHLTADCNLACRYCYEKHTPVYMSEETALAACRLMFSYGHRQNGFSFFGGEPLLCRGLILRVMEFCASQGGKMAYKMTTNGLLLDEEFLRAADGHGLDIALSHDGLMQDIQRLTKNGAGTSYLLEEKIDLLLSHQPKALAMLTVMPENVLLLAESVEWLYKRGFSRINSAIDYRPDAGWDDASMEALDNEYKKLVDICYKYRDAGRPLKYMNFESKIAAHLEGRSCIECRLGIKQPSIAPDGNIYPCNQFLNNKEFRMGDVWNGIDGAKQRRINRASNAPEASCVGCALEKRCRHHCACLNYSLTGDMHTVPPLQCVHERAVIRRADELGRERH